MLQLVDTGAALSVQTKDGMKMGKSLGNVLEPRSLLQAYGADAVRFYFLKEIVFGQVLTPARAPLMRCQCQRRHNHVVHVSSFVRGAPHSAVSGYEATTLAHECTRFCSIY